MWILGESTQLCWTSSCRIIRWCDTMESFRNFILLSLLAVGNATGIFTRIFNGSVAKPTDIPYQVSLRSARNLEHFCGGSIYNENYVITAAHCTVAPRITLQPEDIVIHVGADLRNSISMHNVVSIQRHEEYNRDDSAVNDIALIKVTPPFKFDEMVAPVMLPRPHIVILGNTKALVSGWGSTTFPKYTVPTVLKSVRVPVIDNDHCERLYAAVDSPIYSTHICTRVVFGEGIGACTGDSGGPLAINGVLIGIVSWSRKEPSCGSSLYPNVYTRVAEYVDWIEKHATR